MAKVRPKSKPVQTSDLYSSAQFLELKGEWYERARESGFDDIERADGGLADEDEEHYAKRLLRNSPGRCEALASYYTEAERGLASLVFESPTDRAIWVHHARGSSEREIAEMVGVNRRTVQRRIVKYQKRLGITRPR